MHQIEQTCKKRKLTYVTQVEDTNNKRVEDAASTQSFCSSSKLRNNSDLCSYESTIKLEREDIICANNISHDSHTQEDKSKFDMQQIYIKQELFEGDENEWSQKIDTNSMKMESVKTEEQNSVLNLKISVIKSENIMYNDEDETYYCRRCDYRTVRRKSITEHIQVHLDDRDVHTNTSQSSDEECVVTSSSPKTHRSENVFIGDQCENENQFKLQILKTHSEDGVNVSRFTDLNLSQRQNLATHSQVGEKPYACDYCEYRSSIKSCLKKHNRLHTGEKLYACNNCDFKCIWKQNLIQHLRTHTDYKPYTCSFCDYKCSEKQRLTIHIRTHTGEKPYACGYCDYQCSRKPQLTTHIRTHTGEKPYVCSYCDYKCSQKQNLTTHVRQHTGEKPYACSYCDYQCSRKQLLTTHMRQHTGEKPFSCSYCDYKCSRKHVLIIHMRQHTGEKPYACSSCNYKCSQRQNLITHFRQHTGEKLYACSFCDYQCSQKQGLIIHIRQHTGEKPYACNFCNYRTSYKAGLTKHNRQHTTETVAAYHTKEKY